MTFWTLNPRLSPYQKKQSQRRFVVGDSPSGTAAPDLPTMKEVTEQLGGRTVWMGGKPEADDRGDVTLLPTPTATYPGGEPAAYRARLTEHDGRAGEFVALNMVVEQAHEALHARYGPAIDRRAELIDRPAPPPVFDNPRSRSGVSLSPAFVEWMMCLPDGWVTSLPIARTNQLKILGNGVVPPQAAHAFDHLFRRLEL